MVRVKSNLDGDIHRFVLPDSPTFKELHDHLAAMYSTTDFTVKYKDDEGDHVTVSSDEGLQEAVSSVPDSGLLRVEVLRTTAAPSTAAPRNATTTPGAQPATEPAPAAQLRASTSAGAGPPSNPNPTRDDDSSGDVLSTLMGARGMEVRFLKHLLNNLGYMAPGDYRFRVGVFGPRTASALKAFRRDCGLPKTPLPVYDDVVAAFLVSLIDAGVPPTAATGGSAPPTEDSTAMDSPAMDAENAPTAA